MGWVGVLTDVGQSLLSQYSVGGSTLYITKVQTGTGTVVQSNMHLSTALVDPVTTGSITAFVGSGDVTQFRVVIGPYTSSYTVKEVGIFAKLGENGTETLLALLQNTDGVIIPSSATFPDFALRLSVPVVISNASTVSVTLNPVAYVSQSELWSATWGDFEENG